jgi:hypothetical protein
MSSRKDSPKPDAPEPSDATSQGAGPPAQKDRELMPRPDNGPDDRPPATPPPGRDQRRNRSV